MFRRLKAQPKRPDPAPAALIGLGQRVYAIGDIHGRADLLERLMAKIAADHDAAGDGRTRVLVFLGDYIDRGEQTRETLGHLGRLAQDDSNIHLLLGNHEIALLEFVDGIGDGRAWLNFGGLQTVASYGVTLPGAGATDDALDAMRGALMAAMGKHLDMLRQMRPFWRSGGYFFCHAGVDPGAALDAQPMRDLFYGNAAFIAGQAHNAARVVHGHYDAPAPVVTPGRICVDTGAYYSGKLSAVRLDEGVTFLST